MRFRPCIDIHDGQVKQIVGGSIREDRGQVTENFTSAKDAAWYAGLYHKDSLTGGHVILLNPVSSPLYEATKAQAKSALAAHPGELMAGGGIRPENAEEFLDAGASHVIVTSYVFSGGQLKEENLREMLRTVGRKRLVLDLSCRRSAEDGEYYIVTDRWQNFTKERLTPDLLKELSESCAEYLVHAVDSEGQQKGPERDVLPILAASPIPVTYAGGIHSFEDIAIIEEAGAGKIDFTVGSALDIFGGRMPYADIVKHFKC